MKLVTYDRRGHRRLGALTGGRVVDLPDAVGHPAFPTTLETLISGHGGTVLDAARDALGREDQGEYEVRDARLLVPLLPSSIRDFPLVAGAARNGSPVPLYHLVDHRTVFGPEDRVPWPPFTEALDFEPELACVLGQWGRDLSPEEARQRVFGYALLLDWTARDVERRERDLGLGPGRSKDFATSLGPCIVTPDELEGDAVAVAARVDGEERTAGRIRLEVFAELVAEVSQGQEVWPGDVFAAAAAAGAGGEGGRLLSPGTLVELEAEPVGVLRNRVGHRF